MLRQKHSDLLPRKPWLRFKFMWKNPESGYIIALMENETIVTDSPVGRHLDQLSESKPASYLMFNKKKIPLVAKITIGREFDNNVVVDNKLASRHHAVIQKIRDAYFIKDENSTNGTFVNGRKIPEGKYIRLNLGDKITVGTTTLVIS